MLYFFASLQSVYNQTLNSIRTIRFSFMVSILFLWIYLVFFIHNLLNICHCFEFRLIQLQVPWHVPCGGLCYGDGNLIFIANDWHTSLLPVYLKACYRDNGLMKYARSILVIHNISHQVSSLAFYAASIRLNFC